MTLRAGFMHVYCRCNWFSFNIASAVTLIVWEIPAHDGTMTTHLSKVA